MVTGGGWRAASSRPLGAELQAMVRGDQHLAVWAEVGELASGAEAGEHLGRTLTKIGHLSIDSYRAKRFLTSQQRRTLTKIGHLSDRVLSIDSYRAKRFLTSHWQHRA
jgi:hypothetical protein